MKMYNCLTNQVIKENDSQVVPLREQDISIIKDWRNAQMEVLRQQVKLTDDDQQAYYTNVVVSSFTTPFPRIILFSFLENDQLIGYGGLTNVDWHAKRAEISFLSDPTRVSRAEIYEADFSLFLTLIKRAAFDDLKFNRLFTETYDIRPLHISILVKSGFQLEGILKEHVRIGGNFIDSLIHGYLRSYYDR